MQKRKNEKKTDISSWKKLFKMKMSAMNIN